MYTKPPLSHQDSNLELTGPKPVVLPITLCDKGIGVLSPYHTNSGLLLSTLFVCAAQFRSFPTHSASHTDRTDQTATQRITSVNPWWNVDLIRILLVPHLPFPFQFPVPLQSYSNPLQQNRFHLESWLHLLDSNAATDFAGHEQIREFRAIHFE